MKFFSLIFVFGLLFSIWHSCQNLMTTDVSCSVAAEKINIHDDSESNESEDCSEVCSNCESAEADINLILSVENKFAVLTNKTVENSYQNQYSQNPSDSIWQPPKINFTV